jgi:hypothetical protein
MGGVKDAIHSASFDGKYGGCTNVGYLAPIMSTCGPRGVSAKNKELYELRLALPPYKSALCSAWDNGSLSGSVGASSNTRRGQHVKAARRHARTARSDRLSEAADSAGGGRFLS